MTDGTKMGAQSFSPLSLAALAGVSPIPLALSRFLRRALVSACKNRSAAPLTAPCFVRWTRSLFVPPPGRAKTKPIGYCLPRVRGRWPAGPERASRPPLRSWPNASGKRTQFRCAGHVLQISLGKGNSSAGCFYGPIYPNFTAERFDVLL